MSSPLQNNIVNLQNILDSINNLPEAGSSVDLPKLTNPADASKTLSGYEFINENGSKIIGTMPTVTQATPSISIDNSGLITATAIQDAGYVSAGTKNNTKQLTTQAAKTVTPSTNSQTAVTSGVYTTGAVTVAGDTNLKAENIKSGVSIFGVAGSLSGAMIQKTTGTYTLNSTGDATVDCGFQPDIICIRPISFQDIDNINNESYEGQMNFLLSEKDTSKDGVWAVTTVLYNDAPFWIFGWCKPLSNGFQIHSTVADASFNVTYNSGSANYIAIKYTGGAESNAALLYEIGNQNIEVTGGWGSTGWSGGYYSVNAPTIDNSGMTISGKGEDTLTICGTKNKIDLRNISTLYVTVDQWTFMAPTVESAYFAVNGEKQAMNPATGYNMAAIQKISGTGEIALNVGDIDEGYIVLFVHGYDTSKIRVTQIRME